MNLSGTTHQSLMQKYGSVSATQEAYQASPGKGYELGQTDVRNKEGMRHALKEESKEFESIFVYQMITAMRKTVAESSLIKKSNGEIIFEGMLDEEWARKLSGQNSMSGLSDVIYRQLSRQLGVEDEIGSRKSEMELNQSSPLLQLHTDPSVILSQLPIKDR